MGLFKDAGESIIKYGEIIVNKTEEYTRVAKFTFNIKKLEGDEEKVKIKIGDLIIKLIENGESKANLKDNEINQLYGSIIEIRENINSIKAEIENQKKAQSTQGETENEKSSK